MSPQEWFEMRAELVKSRLRELYKSGASASDGSVKFAKGRDHEVEAFRVAVESGRVKL